MDSEDNHTRPALKEIYSNETTSGALSANNQKQLPAKAPQNKILQLQDNKQQLLEANNLCPSNELLNENNCSAEDERTNKNTIIGTGVVSSDLPSVEFPLSNSHLQSIIGHSKPSLEDSLVSSLAANFNAALVLNATTDDINQSKSLSPPLELETSSSHVSSDNETYVECRSFSPDTHLPSEDSNRFTSALDLVSSITDPSPGWDDLVTSVTEMNMDSLENTNVQLDVPLDVTPTEPVNPDVLDLSQTKTESLPAERDGVQDTSITEEKGNAKVENINLDVTTCMTPETVTMNVASVIENVDSNSCLDGINDTETVNTTSEGKSPSQKCNSADTSATGDEYCSNITVEADHVLPAENNSISSDNNGPISSADVTQDSNQNNSVVLSWATVEKHSASNCSENEANITHDLGSSSSSLHLDLNRTHSPQPEPAGSPLADTTQQFPVRTTPIKNSFPKCPTTFNAPKDLPNVPISPRSPSDSNLNSDPNRTIDIVQTSPNGTTSQPSTSADSADLPNRMDSTFSASTEVLNATTTVASKFDETFDDTSPSAKTDRRSLSPALSNQTINIDNNAAASNFNQTTDEPMDVDVTSPNPNETVSYPTFPPSASSDGLSEKEKCYTKNEKDVFVDKCAFNNEQAFEDMFNSPSGPSMGFSGQYSQPADLALEEDFQSNRLFLNPSDFDFLLTKGNSNVEVDRSSLLLRFDPLLGHSVPVNQPVKAGSSSLSASSLSIDRQQQQQQEFALQNRLSPTNEEEEHFYESDRSFLQENGLNRTETLPTAGKPQQHSNIEDRRQHLKQKPLQITARSIKKNAKMSVDVIQDMKIENDCKSIEQIDTQADEKQNFKMDELEKKIKNEVLKTEDIEKKLKEAEQREEALIKRITEKDKTIAKMNGVIEAYEKAIAELIAEKEQIIQNYEKQLTEVKTDRDSNYHHLTSLETTFSDLHVKYEKSKEMTAQLKSSEEALLAEKRQNLENLRLQEQRYEKMKNHAMQQLEMANNKLESLTKNHSMEITKLKALLKKEEISRASINEQLQQKSRENEELVKICDELINGQGS